MMNFLKNIFGFLWLYTLLGIEIFKRPTRSFGWPKKQWVLGHRGARASAPENTLVSFRLAKELGADGVEFDVTMSKDAVPVVIHDNTLERTTNGKGLVSNYSARELSKLNATKLATGFLEEGVPSLSEALQSFPDGFIVNIELKNPGLFTKFQFAEKVLSIALPHERRLIIIFSSFDGEILCMLRNLKPSLIISLLLSPREKHWPSSLSYWRHIKPDALHVPPILVNRIMVFMAKKANLPLSVWTVNDPEKVRRYFKQGISGVFTDHVAEIIANK